MKRRKHRHRSQYVARLCTLRQFPKIAIIVCRYRGNQDVRWEGDDVGETEDVLEEKREKSRVDYRSEVEFA